MGTRRGNGENEKLRKALGVSISTVEKYVARGMPISDIEAARKWRRENVRPRTGGGKEINETARLRRAQADVAEIEAKKLSGSVVDIEDVDASIMKALAILRTGVRSLGGRIAGPVAQMTDPGEIKRYVAREADRILADTAKALREWAGEELAATRRSSRPAAGSNA